MEQNKLYGEGVQWRLNGEQRGSMDRNKLYGEQSMQTNYGEQRGSMDKQIEW